MPDLDFSNLLPTPMASATPDQIQSMREYATIMMKGQQRQGPYTWGNAFGDISGKLMGAALWRHAGDLQKGGLEEGAKAIPAFDASSGGGGGGAAGGGVAPTAQPSSPDQTAPTPGGGGGAAPAAGNAADLLRAPTPEESVDTLGFIKKWEGFDPVAKWDFKQYSGGYGTRAEKGQTFTPESAHSALVDAVGPVNKFINENVKVPLTPGQRTGITDFAHNLGVGEGGLSDLLPDINKGDWPAVVGKMQHYNRAGGEVRDYLVRRRADDGRMIMSGSGVTPAAAAASAAPSPMAIGPIVNALAGAGGAVTTLPMTPGAPGAPAGLAGPTGASMALPSNPALSQGPGGAPQTIGGALKTMGVPGPALSPTGALAPPQQAAVNAIAGGGPPAPAGPGTTAMTTAIAGTGGAPARGAGPAIPPTPGLPPLPTPAQIQKLAASNIPQYTKQAEEMQAYRMKALTPQQVTDPMTGAVYIGTPYTGYERTGLPGMPQIQKAPFEVGGIKGEDLYTLGRDAQGNFVRQPIRTAQPPGGPATPPAGAGGPGEAMPPMPDTSDKAALANWATQYGAQKKAAEATSEELAKGGVKPMTEAMEKASNAPNMIQNLDIMANAYRQAPSVSGGPLGPIWQDMRAAAAQLGIIDPKDKTVNASNIIEKIHTKLAFQATKELTTRPAASEITMQLNANPGLLMNNQSSLYMIDLMKQQAKQDQAIGRLASSTKSPKDFFSLRDEYYADNPLISPFTHRPINEPGGGLPGTRNGPPLAAPGAAGEPAAPQGGQGAPVRVSSPEEAAKLDKGTVFQTPDGRLKVAPGPSGPAALPQTPQPGAVPAQPSMAPAQQGAPPMPPAAITPNAQPAPPAEGPSAGGRLLPPILVNNPQEIGGLAPGILYRMPSGEVKWTPGPHSRGETPPIQVKSPTEAAEFPPGTVYQTPSGRMWVVPGG